MSEKNYEENLKLWGKAYGEILAVCEKYPNFKEFSLYDIDEMKAKAKNHLLLIEWYEKYGLKLDHSHKPHTYNYLKIDDYLVFSLFENADKCKEEKRGRSISWSDDGRQPVDGWYFQVGFSTGAYIFGEDYAGQQQLFQEFFQELKCYKPDYSDTANSSLYWKIENAKEIYVNFKKILGEYRKKNREKLNERRADKLRAELKKLEEAPVKLRSN